MANQKVTLGGERVGSGNKMKVELHDFPYSSHDIGFILKTDQAPGTLVPYMIDFLMPGSVDYIGIATRVRTQATNGPIFGSFKHQIDVFSTPIRLYIGALHNNALNIGNKMNTIKLPKMLIDCAPVDASFRNPNASQIATDSLLAYIGVRGLGTPANNNTGTIQVKKQALLLLNYWDIYKNYYANKQEGVGYVIAGNSMGLQSITIQEGDNTDPQTVSYLTNKWNTLHLYSAGAKITIKSFNKLTNKDIEKIAINEGTVKSPIWRTLEFLGVTNITEVSDRVYTMSIQSDFQTNEGAVAVNYQSNRIQLKEFPLENIDKMREAILATPKTTEFVMGDLDPDLDQLPYTATYGRATTLNTIDPIGNQSFFSQSGLGIRTYLSDRFNNWLSSEWIDGENGVNEITAVEVVDGKFTMDSLILQEKLFNLLNRIAITDGTYKGWQEAAYSVKINALSESPMYMGGLSSEISFAEVVSTSEADTGNGVQPLGSLAGRGTDHMTEGGRDIKIKASEPTIVMVIGSIVPRVDYSQGNEWWTRLDSMDDFHKPSLDGIGFQELITEEMAAWDTTMRNDFITITKSAGKQPAWIEYMTNTNKALGSFAAGQELEFMALNREYTRDEETKSIQDLTSYIDPTIYNKAFAQSDLGAKNFWVQVAFDVTARRKMSAAQIPNL